MRKLNLDPANPVQYTREDYLKILNETDIAVCEACAVSQAQAGRIMAPNVGYATAVFTNLCGYGVSLMRAAPLSRWSRSEFEHWHFSAVAGYARAILDGCLLLDYLMEPITGEAELHAKLNLMHLNDCTRRMEFLADLGLRDDYDKFVATQEELRTRLTNNDFFKALDIKVQRSCLSGNKIMFRSRDQQVEKLGFDKGQFSAIYDLLSQHIHILPMSFYRVEPNGRGTGLENDVDRHYIILALSMCTACLIEGTNTLVRLTPHAQMVRNGIASKFSPGPESNLPPPESITKSKNADFENMPRKSKLVLAIEDILRN